MLRDFLEHSIGRRLNPFLSWTTRNFFKLVLVIVAFGFLLFFLGTTLKPFLFIGIFLLLSSFSLIYNRWFKVSLGVEFVLLSTVLTARVYGPVAGAIVGFIGLGAAEIIGTGFNEKTIISLVAIAIIGLITPFFNSVSITMTGIILTVIYDIMIIPFYLLAGSNPARSILFVATHLVWNLWVFIVLAPPLQTWML